MATITLRMSEEDAAFIKRYAEMTGTTVSQFIRQAALERIEDEYDREALEAYLAVARPEKTGGLNEGLPGGN